MSMIESTTVAALPTQEELEFYVRKGRRERSEAFHSALKSVFQAIVPSRETTAAAPSRSVAPPLGGAATAR